MENIHVDVASELFMGYDWDDQNIEHVSTQFLETSRWSIEHLVVFSNEGDLYGFYYSEPATEYQDGMDPYDRYDNYNSKTQTVGVFPVKAIETVEYQKAS
jgi:hypothetical protein